MNRIKVLTIIGTRPELIKLSRVIAELDRIPTNYAEQEDDVSVSLTVESQVPPSRILTLTIRVQGELRCTFLLLKRRMLL